MPIFILFSYAAPFLPTHDRLFRDPLCAFTTTTCLYSTVTFATTTRDTGLPLPCLYVAHNTASASSPQQRLPPTPRYCRLLRARWLCAHAGRWRIISRVACSRIGSSRRHRIHHAAPHAYLPFLPPSTPRHAYYRWHCPAWLDMPHLSTPPSFVPPYNAPAYGSLRCLDILPFI